MKIIIKLIALLSIITSTDIFIRVYPDLNAISYNSKGWVEYVVLITSVLFIFNFINLTIILNQIPKHIMLIILILYLLSVLIPMYNLNHILLIPTVLFSFISLIISNHFVYNSNTKQALILSILLFILSTSWAFVIHIF